MPNAEQVVRQVCAEEANRPEAEVRIEYGRRLDAALNLQVQVPACLPVSVRLDTQTRAAVEEWIDPSRVAVRKGWHPYHHSRDQMLDYAVQHRGDADHLLAQMPMKYRGLVVEEYPTPGDAEPLYFVSTNGNHRRLVFHAIGLPWAKAIVTPCEREQWSIWGREQVEWLRFFEHLGLVSEIQHDGPARVLFKDETGVVGWVLPQDVPMTPQQSRQAAADMSSRLQDLEHFIGTCDGCAGGRVSRSR